MSHSVTAFFLSGQTSVRPVRYTDTGSLLRCIRRIQYRLTKDFPDLLVCSHFLSFVLVHFSGLHLLGLFYLSAFNILFPSYA